MPPGRNLRGRSCSEARNDTRDAIAASNSAVAMALVIAGSYEGGLHGWTFDNDNYELKFSFAAHQGCIRCVATNSHVEDAQPLLLTGGDDEVIRAFSLSL